MVQRDLVMADRSDSPSLSDSGGEDDPIYEFSDCTLATLPPKEVQSLIARLQALAARQVWTPSISHTPLTQPTENEAVVWEDLEQGEIP